MNTWLAFSVVAFIVLAVAIEVHIRTEVSRRTQIVALSALNLSLKSEYYERLSKALAKELSNYVDQEELSKLYALDFAAQPVDKKAGA